MGDSFKIPVGVKPLPESAVEALRRAARAQEKAQNANQIYAESLGALNRELEPVILDIIGTGGEHGVTLSQISDVVEARMGVSYDIFPVCRELFRQGLIEYRKEIRANRAGKNQLQSVQYLTDLGLEVYEGKRPWF